jgi:hypothetical protein
VVIGADQHHVIHVFGHNFLRVDLLQCILMVTYPLFPV